MANVLDRLAGLIGRICCRVLGWHGRSCRGRSDHWTRKETGWHPLLRRLNL